MTAPPIKPSEWWMLVDRFGVPWYIETCEDDCMSRLVHWGPTSQEDDGWTIRRVIVTEAPEVDQ